MNALIDGLRGRLKSPSADKAAATAAESETAVLRFQLLQALRHDVAEWLGGKICARMEELM